MAEITGIWWQPFRVPLRRPLLAAHGTIQAREGLIVGIRTPAGEGLGEVAPLPSFGGGSASECAAFFPAMAARVLGHDARGCWSSTYRADASLSRGSAAALACGIETALGDLLARESGLPLWRWLASTGGLATDATEATIPVNALIDATEPAEAAREARLAVAAGYATLKVKVGRDAGGDRARLAAVHEAAGPGVALRIDANGAWDVDEAIDRLASYAGYGVTLVEQPTSASRPDAVEALGRVRAKTTAQVAGDESCVNPSAAARLVETGAVDAVVVKPMMIGLRDALQIVAMATGAGVSTIVTTSFETGVGTAAAIHLAGAMPAPRSACGLSTLGALEFDITRGAPSVERGVVTLTGRPGLGVPIDAALLGRAATGPRQALGEG